MAEGSIKDTVTSTLSEFAGEADQWGRQALAVLGTDVGLDPPASIQEHINTLLALIRGAPIPDPDELPEFDPNTGSFGSPGSMGSVSSRSTAGSDLDEVSYPNRFGTFSISPSAGQPSDSPEVEFPTDAPSVVVPELRDLPEVTAPLEVLLSAGRTYLIPEVEILPVEVEFPDDPRLSAPSALDYREDGYSTEFLGEALTWARGVLEGRTLMPAWVWDGIWSRGAGNLLRQERAALRQARSEHASRGWMMPGVVLLAREADARQKSAEALSELTRENATQQATMIREDMWKAMETGLACEKLLFEADNAFHERMLKAAVETVNAATTVYSAMVQAHNVLVQAALGKAQTLKMAMEARLMAFEKVKLELQVGALESEQDKQRVALYEAQWKGEETRVRAYEAWADAVKSYVEAQKANVEAFGLEVQAKQNIVQSWATEWQVWGQHKLEPERLKISAQQAENGLFAQSVAHWQTAIQQKKTQFDAGMDLRKYEIQYDTLDVERYKAEVANFDQLNRAATAYAQATAQIYQAVSQVTIGKMGVDLDTIKAKIAGAAQGADAAAKAGGLAVETYKAQAGLAVQHVGAQASVFAQLGSAAYAAANISLGASSGFNESQSWSRSRGYDVNVSVPIDEASGVQLTPPSGL